ncbi:hypothetical protein VU04_04390 [Desulfobulbus sp. TB]|nr:hypothetical protein [Desulfobulbus sp. TB]
MKKLLGALLFIFVATNAPASDMDNIEDEEKYSAKKSGASIIVRPSQYGDGDIPNDRVTKIVQEHYSVDDYRRITAQVIYDDSGTPSHITVRLFSKEHPTYDIAMIDIDKDFNVQGKKGEHTLGDLDHSNQIHHAARFSCPDTSIQFLAMSPSTEDNVESAEEEQAYAQEVADEAIKQGYKTKTLFGDEGTTQNILNYMLCPNLVGTFYDGDANPQEIATHDGTLSHADIEKYLSDKLNGVTNIWLACEAFNDPMLSAMQKTGAKVYAAGINKLEVGTSDKAAVCTMKAAINGQPMTEAMDNCVDRLDATNDQWGWHSSGESDIFGK